MSEDHATLYRDAKGEWRWKRVDSGNHKEVGASTEGYENKSEAKANYRRLNGATGPELIELPDA
jgi:uncharacterized protein YegP (UPF0339 family)